MKNFEKEAKAIEKLEFIIETFEYQIGKAALEVLEGDNDHVDSLDQPEALAPEDITEDSLMERDGELDDWKFNIIKILALTNQRVVETVNEIEPFEPGTF